VVWAGIRCRRSISAIASAQPFTRFRKGGPEKSTAQTGKGQSGWLNSTGTLAPNSICSTTQGLAFVAPDGMRIITFTGAVTDPIGNAGSGVTVPFTYSSVPSRIAAAANGNNIRLTTQNGNISSNPTYEYWYNISRKIWHGPHTFPAALIQPWMGTFVLVPTVLESTLWQSDAVQSLSSTFTENGTQMVWAAQTSLLPDTDSMTNVCITETSLDLSLPPTAAPATR